MTRGRMLVCLLLGCLACRLTNAGAVEQIAQATPTGRVIAGEEALRLYGVGVEPTAVAPTAAPMLLFPVTVRVTANEHPYDPAETITELPMFTRPTLNGIGGGGKAGTWLGDLATGQQVVLHTWTPEQVSCLVEGDTIQGWTATGWVACNRLEAAE